MLKSNFRFCFKKNSSVSIFLNTRQTFYDPISDREVKFDDINDVAFIE